jgi:hypothetical protein
MVDYEAETNREGARHRRAGLRMPALDCVSQLNWRRPKACNLLTLLTTIMTQTDLTLIGTPLCVW